MEKYTFIGLLENKEGKEIIEAIEEIDKNTEDKILLEIRNNLIKKLKEKFGYIYGDK